MPGPHVVTFGCRLNAFESEVIRAQATAIGVENTVYVNTCAVTGEAVRQARQRIRKLRRDHPGRRIVVTGCAAQLSPQSFAAMPEVDQVVGNREKLEIDRVQRSSDRLVVSDILRRRETAAHLVEGLAGRSRAFVQIQQGCDHRCTFCIIPFARGGNESLPSARIVEQVRRLVDNGHHEVVLTGVDICSYGRDRGDDTLGHLARTILDGVPGLRRLRLSSLDPAAVDPELVRVLADDARLMPHIHLSVQALDNLVLKRMKRRHSRHDVERLMVRLRAARPDVVFGADLIAGFPTESEAMFETTLASVVDLGFTYLHVFPFSPRSGTPAARMPQVPSAVRQERAARLRQAGVDARRHFFARRVGMTTEVLVETLGTGRCPYYAPVRVPEHLPVGGLARVRLVAADDDCLHGEPT